MIDILAQPATPQPAPAHGSRTVFRMIQGERTAGSMPVWEKAVSPALACHADNAARQADPEPFSFGDLLDMVNPLQHIPVVSHFYRALTGDEIRPSGKIIGGGIFGGIAGIAGGLVNLVLEKETGQDMTGNAIHFIETGNAPRLVQRPPAATHTDELPPALLAFADLSHGAAPKRPVWERG